MFMWFVNVFVLRREKNKEDKKQKTKNKKQKKNENLLTLIFSMEWWLIDYKNK